MIRHFLIISLLATAMTAYNQTPVPGGNISGTWTASGSPYLVQGSIMVPNDSMLIIQPGVTVNFQGHYKFLILGRLLALGTEAEKIVFTAANQTSGWYGIRFDNTSSANDSSIIEYCQISWGRATNPEPWGGGIEINNFSKVRVSHCLIKNNYSQGYGGGIDCSNADPLITNNTFDSNTADFLASTLNGGGAISCNDCNAQILYNTFINNTSSSQVGGGGAIFFSGGSPLISNNVIIYNSNTNNGIYGDGGGGGIFADGHATIINNTISNNSTNGYTIRGGGIFFYWNDHSTLINNTVTNNSATGSTGCGGAIYCFITCNPSFTNNTIANNYAGQDGGALYCYSSSHPTFRNCILYGNTTSQDTNQVFLYDEASDPDFSFCNVQRGVAGFNLNGNFYTGIYQNNINSKPLFNWPSQGSGTGYNGVIADWSESGISPCVNAGDPTGTYPDKDKAGNPRVVDNRIDIGAYEDQFPVGFASRDFHQQTLVYPNPFNNSTVIHFRTITAGGTLRIFDAYGKTLQIIPDISGDHVRIERGNLPAGVCYYEIITGNIPFAAGKLVIIDQ